MHAVLIDINTYIIKQSYGAHDPCTSRISERYQNLAFEFGSGYKGTSEVEARLALVLLMSLL